MQGRELNAAQCASTIVAAQKLGQSAFSRLFAALEFFFRNISRDAVNINNKFCCQYQSEAQVSATA